MKTIELNRGLIATLFATGLALAGTNAFAMTTEHDTGGKDKDAAVHDSGDRKVADNVIGGRVGNLTPRDLGR